MLQRAYNFSPGPAMLPHSILLQIQAELLDWRQTGVSALEIGHRTAIFQQLLTEIKAKVRHIFSVPNDYQILFAAGGAQGQFDAVPLNLLSSHQSAIYAVSGIWSKKAAVAAAHHANVHVIMSDQQQNCSEFAATCMSTFSDTPAEYLYFCHNETVEGIALLDFATDLASHCTTSNLPPLVTDVTSSLGAVQIDCTAYKLLFAATQKNLGIAGLTLVIVHHSVLDQAQLGTPHIWHYRELAKHHSTLNTPPTFAIYVLNCMLDWITAQGGISTLSALTHHKSQKLYNYIENSNFYFNKVRHEWRSPINISFYLYQADLVPKFIAEATAAGLLNLAGHSSVGGIRANLYLAMPLEAIDALLDFMHNFAYRQ